MNYKYFFCISFFLSIFVTVIACENSEEVGGDLQDRDIRGGGGMPVFLLAGQSNMVGNVDKSLHNNLVYELETGSSQTRQQRLVNRLTSWYRDWSGGYAWYGYSQQMVTLEASELIELQRKGLVSSSLTQPYSKVYCASSDSPGPKPLALNCGSPYGPELVLGHVLGKSLTQPSSLIKVAKGGTTLYSDWLPPSAARRNGRSVGHLYQLLSQRIKSLRASPASVHPNCSNQQCRWSAFVWFQGENDSMDQASAREYQKNLANLISDVRAEIGSPQLPVIIVGLGRWPQQDLAYGKTIVAAQKAVVSEDPYVKFVVTDDLSGFYHYDAAGQLIIGNRIAEKLIPMLKYDDGGGGGDGGGDDVAQGVDGVLGHYERTPVLNFYHKVDIVRENGGLWWRIGSGLRWSLSYAGGVLKTGSDCPYGPQTIQVVRPSVSGAVTALLFNGERYRKIGSGSGGDGADDGGGGGDSENDGGGGPVPAADLRYFGTNSPRWENPPASYKQFKPNVLFYGALDGLDHQPTDSPGAGKFLYNRVFRSTKHGMTWGDQFGLFAQWLGSFGNNSVEGGLWVNPYVTGPHYYPSLHLAAVSDCRTYHQCSDIQFGTGMTGYIGDKWLAEIQIANRVLTVPGANLSFDKDQPTHYEDNGIWVGWGWTYLNLKHPKQYKYWISFVETYDYQGPINGYMPEYFNWVNPDSLNDGSYHKDVQSNDPFGTLATLGSAANTGVGSEQYQQGLKLNSNLFYAPVPRVPNHKNREYLVANVQSISQDTMEQYSSSITGQSNGQSVIPTRFIAFNGLYSTDHSQLKLIDKSSGHEEFIVVRPPYEVGYDKYNGYIEWPTSGVAAQAKYEQNGNAYYKRTSQISANRYRSQLVPPPDDVERVPRVESKFMAFNERDTSHPDFRNWDTSGMKRYTVKLQNGSMATYVWFKFIDQPAVKTARQNWPQIYTNAYLERLQTYIENLHRKVAQRSKKNPSNPVFINYRNKNNSKHFDPHLAKLDPGQLVQPPAGKEVGYVPIVISVTYPSDQSVIDGNHGNSPVSGCRNSDWSRSYFPNVR